MSAFVEFMEEREKAEKAIHKILTKFERKVGHNCISNIKLGHIKKTGAVMRVLLNVNINKI